MILDNLVITRMIIHEVFQIPDNGVKKSPVLSNQLVPLNEKIQKELSTRIVDVIRKAIEIKKDDEIEGSYNHILEIKDLDDNQFIEKSKIIVSLLADAQNTRIIKDSAIFVMSGEVGFENQKFSCLIKAEFDNSFQPVTENDSNEIIGLEAVVSFLGKEQKLYKLVVFTPSNNAYKSYLFDSNLSFRNTASAAKYFYKDFLGSEFSNQGGVAIQNFNNLTQIFIDSMFDDYIDKIRYLSILLGYIRGTNNTLSIHDFSIQAFDNPETSQEYINFMLENDFFEESVPKDSEIASKIQIKPKLKFNSGISISGNINDISSNLISISKDDCITTLKIRGDIEVLK
ncbi:hypothetical protein BK011_02465 [Tenericutes bacterium MZ-XQ]|nr:hypothetical protein BK011_02465 [Tenericutes bacterium MZ-XQ]